MALRAKLAYGNRYSIFGKRFDKDAPGLPVTEEEAEHLRGLRAVDTKDRDVARFKVYEVDEDGEEIEEETERRPAARGGRPQGGAKKPEKIEQKREDKGGKGDGDEGEKPEGTENPEGAVTSKDLNDKKEQGKS